MDSINKALIHAQPPWWIQICHLAWIGLRFFWGTLIVGLLINVIATLVFLGQGTNLQTLFIGRMLDWGSRHLLVIVMITVVVLAITALTWVGSRQIALYAPQKLQSAPVEQAHAISRRDGIIYRAGYKRRYFRYLSSRHDRLEVNGLPRGLEQSLELLPVFVELCLVNKPAHRVTADPIKPPDTHHNGRKKIWDYLLKSREHLVILGAPGSGKTTLLKYVTIALAKQNREALNTPYRLPFFLFLREFQDDIKEDSKKIPTFFLPRAIEKDLHRWGLTPPPGWVEHQLTRKGCLILLDGLDEVAEKENRRYVVDWVQRQMEAYRSCSFVITSRKYGYLGNELSNSSVLEVQSFTFEQITHFIKNWYLIRENTREGRLDERKQRIRQADEEANDLIQRLQHSRLPLRKLAANPLLLTMIAMVHRDLSTLPENRVELYQEVCEVFLGRRDEARNLPIKLRPSQQQLVLEHLAYHLMQEKVVMMAEEKVIELIKEPLAKVDPEFPQKEFLDLVENRGGLFLEKEPGLYGFTHKAFQEYLAAVHIEKSGRVHELVNLVGEVWWRETILLYCSQFDATPLIKACLAVDPPSVAVYELAGEILKMLHHVEPDTRAKLIALVNQEMKDPLQQKIMAVASLNLSLSEDQMIPLSVEEDVFVTRSFISCIVYQLFLDERYEEDQTEVSAFPDHWRDEHFPSNHAQKPVLGVRFSDAKEFCKWLNDREEVIWHYRLPAEKNGEWRKVEAQFFGAGDQPPDCGFWSDSGSRIIFAKRQWPRLTESLFKERLILDRHLLERSYQLIEPSDITTSLNAMQGLLQARMLLDELARMLVGIRGRLSKSERELQTKISKFRSEIYQHETDIKSLQKKQANLKAELTKAKFDLQQRKWSEVSILASTKERIDFLSQQQFQVDMELTNLNREKKATQASIERENRRWFPNKQHLNELQDRSTRIADGEQLLIDQRSRIQPELNQLERKMNRLSSSATQFRTEQEADQERSAIENQLTQLHQQETELIAFREDAQEHQSVLQAQLSRINDLSLILSRLCDQQLAFVLNYNSSHTLSRVLRLNPGLNFDYVLEGFTRSTNASMLDSISGQINMYKDELLKDLTQFISIASGEVEAGDLFKLNSLIHALAYILELSNFQQNVRMIAETLESFLTELIRYRPLGKTSPLLRSAIRYSAWILGEQLAYWSSKEMNSTTSQNLDYHRILDVYLNLTVFLALLEERIEEKLPPTEGIVLIKERREIT